MSTDLLTGAGCKGLTISEAASQLGISRDGVRKRIRRGLIAARKTSDGEWRVDLLGLDKQDNRLDKRETSPGQAGQEARQETRQADNDPGQARQETVQADKERDRARQAEIDLALQFVETLRSENTFLRSQLEERGEELKRRDVIIQTLAQRAPQLAAPAEEPQKRPATVATAMPARRWWQVWRR